MALASPDWNERHGALLRIGTAYPDALPGTLVDRIISLLTREAAAQVDHAGDEAFGEYVVDLVLTAVRTGDVRAVPSILLLDGLGISSGVAAFVASQGRAVMPALDSIARTREDRASDVIETYALMYARYGARLRRADSAQVLRRLLAAAGDTSLVVRSQLALVAARGRIAELLVPVAELAASDSAQLDGVYVVRLDAGRALPILTQAQTTLNTSTLLNRLSLLTRAACDDAEGRLGVACIALDVELAVATRFVAAGDAKLVLGALGVYQRTVQRMMADRLIPRLVGVTLDGTARAVAERF